VSRHSARPEFLLTCRGCGTRTPVASVHLDEDGDPVLTGRLQTLATARYSYVRDLAAETERPDLPQKVTLFCGRGHELQVNVPPLMEELGRMEPRRVRHTI
jgi:hypothetical protein